MVTNSVYDVAICGAGLAGLGLARQLKLSMPELSIIVLEKSSGSVPVSSYKVGEALDESSNYYLSEILQIKTHLDDSHVPKMGLRWFFENGDQPIETRPELGSRDFLAVHAYQVERRVLENHLRQINEESNIPILKGVLVKDIFLSEDNSPHEVLYTQHGTDNLRIKCRWVIDAMGRRRFLQTKLNLQKPSGHRASAVWFQLQGKYNLDDMVDDPAWRARTKQERWFSTSHLMGYGYWVWVIPLGTGNTSVGIVAAEDIHPLHERKNLESAMEWLRKNEPYFAKFIENATPLNFLAVKDFCYDSHQIFSEQRWACIGESGVFVDPFFSPGILMLSYSNCLTFKMIELEQKGELTKTLVDQFNNLLLNDIGHNYLEMYRNNYPLFRSFEVMSLKILWDTTFIWYFAGAMFFQQHLTNPEVLPRFSMLAQKFLGIHKRMQILFRSWGEHVQPFNQPFFLGYNLSGQISSDNGNGHSSDKRLLSEFFKEAHYGLLAKKDPQQFLDDLEKQVEEHEVWAQLIFRYIVNKVMPEQLSKFPKPFWINAWAISLDPEKWQEDGLFEPKTEPKDIQNFVLPADVFGGNTVEPSAELAATID